VKYHRRSHVLAVSLVICGVLLACGLSALFIPRSPSIASRAQQLAEARDRWQSQPLPHYRLVMHAPSWCRLDVEIQAEKVVHVFENSCPTSPRTVTGLFDLIKQLDSTAETIFCAPRGCECTEVRYIYASYDQQMGFPQTIRLRRDRWANWPELWSFVVTHGVPNCLAPRDIDLVQVVSLKPIS
jgi:uncharacterized protein DUF6174